MNADIAGVKFISGMMLMHIRTEFSIICMFLFLPATITDVSVQVNSP